MISVEVSASSERYGGTRPKCPSRFFLPGHRAAGFAYLDQTRSDWSRNGPVDVMSPTPRPGQSLRHPGFDTNGLPLPLLNKTRWAIAGTPLGSGGDCSAPIIKEKPRLKPPAQSKKPVRVGELIHKRLRETNRTPMELAEAAHVPTAYIADLIAGRRRPPLPSRTDVYDRMDRLPQARADGAGGLRPGGT